MGQHISRNQLVFGVAAIALRDTLKLIGNSSVASPWFAERLSLSATEANRLLKELLEAGWVKVDEHDEEFVELTQEGHAFTMARATRPLRRARADRLLAGAIEASKQINADGSLPSYVEELYVFGSYLGNAQEIGDLDLGLSMKRRYGKMTVDQWVKWASAFGHANCRAHSFLSVLFYHEEAIRRAIRQRSSYVSIHSIDDLDTIKAERKLIFKAKLIAAPRPMTDAEPM